MMVAWILLLLSPIAWGAEPSPKPAALKLTPHPIATIEHVRGKVVDRRGGKERRLSSETKLLAGALVETGADSTAEIHTGALVAQLAPSTRVLVASSRHLSLESGQVRWRVLGGNAGIEVPATGIHAAGGKGTVLLAGVAADEKQYNDRLQGRPSVQLALKGRRFSELLCESGELHARARGGRLLTLRPGDFLKLSGEKAPFAPGHAGLDEVRATARSLGFNDSP